MKQKLKRFMAGFMAMLTLVGTLFTNGTTAFAASPQANIAFWNASVKNSGEVSELKPGYNHGKILYSILDGNSAYCMNFGLRADGGQLMNSYDDASTSMSAQQRKLLSYCLYYGFNSTQKAAPSNSQCDEYIATQAMVWVIVADIFGTGSGDSAARKLCNTAPSPDSSYSYYERLRDNISSSYNATLPSFASRRTSEAPTYELKWNEGSQRFETTLSDSNGVLSDFDFGISGYSVDKNGNSITISSTSVNTTATTGTFTSNAGKVETTSSCVFWLTGKSGYQEFISERPTADPVKAYIKVKTENIGYGELTKTDESSGVKLSGAVYGIYSDSGCTNRVQTMTTDGNGYAKSADDKIFKRFDDFLDEMGENLKKNGDPTESVLYLKRLCKRSIYSGAKIRKNDGLDYSIMTCLAKENVVNETDSSVDLNNTFSLTFDANLYSFSKENSVLYKKEIYDELLK